MGPAEVSDCECTAQHLDSEPTIISAAFTPDEEPEQEPAPLDEIDGEAALPMLVSREVERCLRAEDINQDERLTSVLPAQTKRSRLKVVKRADGALATQ